MRGKRRCIVPVLAKVTAVSGVIATDAEGLMMIRDEVEGFMYFDRESPAYQPLQRCEKFTVRYGYVGAFFIV
jgi:hypothetical protein